jgi:ubiquinone/menaquinone biosynthesis C-methylase UbiE
MINPPRNPRPQPPGKEFVSTDWGEVADWYDQHVGESGGEYHQRVVIPGALRLLAAGPGEKVLDVACGQGVFCRVLQSRGINVTGVDAAEELIRAARHRGPAEIQYLIGDARDLSNLLPAGQFDAAVCLLAIQNVHPLPPIFQNVARVLKSAGRLVIVMMHPCFRGPKETSWGWDESAKTQYRRIDRYLLPRKTPIATHPGSNPNQYTWTFHRPIGGYVKALRGAGFLIDAMEEWPSHKESTSGPRAAAENVARQEIPMFLAMRAVKMRGERGRRPDAEMERPAV